MGQLTTHVLDTAHGQPAQGIRISIYRLADGQRRLLGSAETNSDGRCDAPLLQGEAFTAGIYELEFAVGPHFARRGAGGGEPPFVGDVVLRFGVADAGQHYHVPLLVSPWSYSTYRGS